MPFAGLRDLRTHATSVGFTRNLEGTDNSEISDVYSAINIAVIGGG